MLAHHLLAHLLEQNAWARERLAAFAGEHFVIDVPPWPKLHCAIDADGHVREADPASPVDARLLVTPDALLRTLVVEPRSGEAWRGEGNPELVATLRTVLPRLEWDLEADLARLLGDVLGYRAGKALRQVASNQGEAAWRLAGAAAEYLSEERALVVSRARFAQLTQDIQHLADAVERLAERIGRIA